MGLKLEKQREKVKTKVKASCIANNLHCDIRRRKIVQDLKSHFTKRKYLLSISMFKLLLLNCKAEALAFDITKFAYFPFPLV